MLVAAAAHNAACDSNTTQTCIACQRPRGATPAKLHRLVNHGKTRARNGKLTRTRFAASRESTGFTQVTTAGKRLLVKQRNWRKWIRGPEKETWQVSVEATLLPTVDPLWSRRRRMFGTCAVVGSSGSLLQGECGGAIDEHDAVWRINDAPVRGFERFVGSRETVRVLNAPLPYLRSVPARLPRGWGALPSGRPMLLLAEG